MMSFKEYLENKKIDSGRYQASEPDQWSHFSSIFMQMHPKSFTMQKLNLINGIRRTFPRSVELTANKVENKKAARPVMKPKTTPSESSKPKITTKPKMSKPVMKPKTTHLEQSDSIADKPKPVTKPKIPSAGKAKMLRSVIKPKAKE